VYAIFLFVASTKQMAAMSRFSGVMLINEKQLSLTKVEQVVLWKLTRSEWKKQSVA
jgi:hypothetical protein